LDEFTYQCFAPDIDFMKVHPNNWEDKFQNKLPDALFVESAWNGNDGSWQYKIAKYDLNQGNDLLNLLSWSNKNCLPTIFWNKEDPPHYERFIENAKKFDFIFTSDANSINRYKKDVGHKRIYPLPFAAQPKIHNPIIEEQRKLNVCFSGTYYGDIFPERKKDMEVLLKPSLDYGLHIYDRQFGVIGADKNIYQFPEIYQPSIKGRLEYLEMVKHYKKYKVFLNVNSIKSSPTMFSRRVFELLASGTVVISTYSKGIEELLGSDLVLLSDSEADTKKYLEKLIYDDFYWSELSVKGIRKVFEFHTYNHRLNFILDKCNLDLIPLRQPKFTLLVNVNDYSDIDKLKLILSSQNYRNFNVILLVDNELQLSNQIKIWKIFQTFQKINIKILRNTDEIRSNIDGDFLAIINPKDLYGPNYLRDYALSVLYNKESKIIGKTTYFRQTFAELKLENQGSEYMVGSKALISTLAIEKTLTGNINLFNLLNSEWYDSSNINTSILSLDRFNYLKVSSSENLNPELLKKVFI